MSGKKIILESLIYIFLSWKARSFTPPPEREAYIKAKKSYNPSSAESKEELKKMLMRRAISAIPMILSLQNEGNAIERLYKKGMLTDDMHFRVTIFTNYIISILYSIM